MVITDASVWIDFFNGVDSPHVNALRALLQAGEAALGDLIVFEVLQGFRSDHGVRTALALFQNCHVMPMVSPDLAVQAACLYRSLRRKGITIRAANDALIAAAVIAGDHILLHSDRDFDHFERHLGLQVLHP
ncbi:PIN domain-containing protein [bacterium]|nr:PIN domain-containing protein [bacterium]